MLHIWSVDFRDGDGCHDVVVTGSASRAKALALPVIRGFCDDIVYADLRAVLLVRNVSYPEGVYAEDDDWAHDFYCADFDAEEEEPNCGCWWCRGGRKEVQARLQRREREGG